MKYFYHFLWLAICITILCPFNVFSQNINFPIGGKNGTGQAGNRGMDYYTGTKAINIPLWTCSNKDFSFPVELVYTATGIRVDQAASWVGLGWDLNAGGSITRIVKGFADDVKLPYNEQLGWLFVGEYETQRLGQKVQTFPESDESAQTLALDYYLGEPSSYVYERADAEPDIYYFNFCGIAGSFVFDGSGQAKTIEASNLMISYTQEENGMINSFQIIDEDGNKYIFSDKESVKETNQDTLQLQPPPFPPPPISGNYSNFPASSQEYTSKWHLSKIITYYKEEINFSYTLEKYHLDEFPYTVYSGFMPESGSGKVTDLLINSFTKSDAVANAKRLAFIESDKYKLEFCANTVRQDIIYSGSSDLCKELDQIKVFSKIVSASSTPVLIKKFDFTHSYFESSTGGQGGIYTSGAGLSMKRLKLLSVQAKDNNSEPLLPPYSFQYNENSLPSRFSFAQDFWGYYNGQSGNNTLIPTIYVYPDISEGGSARFRLFPVENNNHSPVTTYILPGADRTPNSNTMSNWSLIKVVSPTGGYEEFEYEPHGFSDEVTFTNLPGTSFTTPMNGGGLRLKKCTLSDGVDHTKDIVEQYTYTGGKAVTLPVYGFFDPQKWLDCGDCSYTSPSTETYFNIYYLRATADLSNKDDGNIGYDKVAVTRVNAVDNTTLGRIEYEFLNEGTLSENNSSDNIFIRRESSWCRAFYDVGNAGGYVTAEPYLYFTTDEYPYPPNTNYSWARGIPLKVSDYNVSGVLVNKSIYQYQTFYTDENSSKIYGLKIGFLTNSQACLNSCGVAGPYREYPLRVFAKYPILTGISKLPLNIEQTAYDPQGNPGLPVTTDYEYNQFGQVNKITTTGADLIQHITRTSHIKDVMTGALVPPYDEPTHALIHLFAENRIADPIETCSLLKRPQDQYERVIGARLTNFKMIQKGNTSDYLALPVQTFDLSIISPLDFQSPNSDVTFTFSNAAGQSSQARNTYYELTDVADLYDDKWNPVQAHKNNDIPLSTIWGYGDSYPVCSVINATVDEIGFTGFENSECPGWSNGQPIIDTEPAHTGKFVVKVNSGYGPTREFTPSKALPVGGMKASVWVKGSTDAYLHIEISDDWTNHQRVSNVTGAGDWNLLEVELTADQVKQAISQQKKLKVYIGNSGSTDAFFDDLRVYPSDAQMTTSTVDPFFGITSTTDSRNQTNWFEHDNLGVQTIVRDQDRNILVRKEYNIGQTQGTNWVKTRNIRTEVQDESGLQNLSVDQHTTMFNYFDGLGRTEQQVIQQYSPNEQDFVQPVLYDGFGLKSKNYEPFADQEGTGGYKPDVIERQQSFYQQSNLVAHTGYPFSQIEYEKSPLLRISQKSAPGFSWYLNNGHTQKQDYAFNNTAADGTVRKWILREDKKSCFSGNDDYYAQAELIVLTNKDENSTTSADGSVMRTYYDQSGKTVMTRNLKDGSVFIDTYYVYDEFDQLIIVIPPKAVDLMSTNQSWDTFQLDEDLVYIYNYDRRHRLIEKKVPGKESEGTVYDLLDRISLTQDGNLRAASNWNFFKYDVLGRLVMTGIKHDAITSNQQEMQAIADAYVDTVTTFSFETRSFDSADAPDQYTNRAFPFIPSSDESKPMVYYYYDKYPVDIESGRYMFRTESSFPSVTGESLFHRLDGITTAVKRRKLDPADESFLMTVNYYDKYLRPIEVLTDNHFGGLDATFYEYDFEGKLLSSLFIHNYELPPSGSFTTERIYESYDYDSHGRLKTHWHKINDEPETVILASYARNELGQVVQKKLHSADGGLNFLQTVDYRYNVRGWLTNINRCDLNNSNIFTTNETNSATEETVTGITIDTLILSIDTLTDSRGLKYLRATFHDKKNLSVRNEADSASYSLENDETANSNNFEIKQEDSLQYAILKELKYSEIIFDLGQLQFGETDDPDELMDTISKLIDESLIKLDITDSLTRSVIINMALVYEQSRIGSVYFNNNENDLFGMDILYNEGFSQLNAPGQYNGNIAGIRWQQSANPGQRGYGYQYDKLNELTNSGYAERTTTGWNGNQGKYDEKQIGYDLNGNITTLKRTGPTGVDGYEDIDDLEYRYTGNQLTSVVDHATRPASELGFRDLADNNQEYGYDANGNLIRDDNKGITSITYNFLNLPVEIHFDNSDNNKIVYLYDAFGTKLRKRVYTGGELTNQMDYTSGALYSANMGGDPVLQYLSTADGRVVKDADRYSYQYFLTDHLGNVRVVFGDEDKDGVADVVQDNHYYPYGMTMGYLGGLTLGGLDNPFKYQGKELQEDAFDIEGDPGKNIHLDLYDFHARQYDPQLGRWHVPDPLNQHMSPYLAMGNNPVNSVDPTGCENIGGYRIPRDGFIRMIIAHGEYQSWLDGRIGRGTAGFYTDLEEHGMYVGIGGGSGSGMSGGAPGIIATMVKTNFGGGIILVNGDAEGNYKITDVGRTLGLKCSGNMGITKNDLVFRTYRGGWGVELESSTGYIETDNSYKFIKGVAPTITWISAERIVFGKNSTEPSGQEGGNSKAAWDVASTTVGVLGTGSDIAKESGYVTTIGTNLKPYASGWAGNQYVKTMGVAKGASTVFFLAGAGADVYMYSQGYQSGAKTLTNLGVSGTAMYLGGIPGIILGGGYMLIDKTVGWDRVMTPASNDQWVPNRATFPDGTTIYVCFKAGTQIFAKEGSKPIEQIIVGDSVYSYNIEKNIIELSKVVKSFERKTQEIYELTTDNQKIYVTAEHPFYVVGNGWVKVKDLKDGAVLKTKDGSIEHVTSSVLEKHPETVYNIEVEGNHNYFVTNSNILVHNK